MTFDIDRLKTRAEEPEMFIKECEKEYGRKLSAAADAIAENRKYSPVVLLSGPSGSGKTTTAMKIEEKLERRGIMARTISLDNYFRDKDDTYPKTQSGELDLESPLCLDLELLNEHYELLMEGKPIRVPKFDFTVSKRSPTEYEEIEVGENEILIFEGLHALNGEIAGAHPEAFGLFVCVLSHVDFGENEFLNTWVRLLRRLVRDKNFRGAEAEYTLELWENVLDGERKYITPFKDRAKMEIDSFLPYELFVMRDYALPLLKSARGRAADGGELEKITEMLESIGNIDERLVPKNSLLREFIGGGIYSY